MFTTSTNFHHSKLPRVGEIGTLIMRRDRYGKASEWVGDGRIPPRFIVESYPVTDSPDMRYSVGVHTANFRRLSDGKVFKAAGHFFEGV